MCHFIDQLRILIALALLRVLFPVRMRSATGETILSLLASAPKQADAPADRPCPAASAPNEACTATRRLEAQVNEIATKLETILSPEPRNPWEIPNAIFPGVFEYCWFTRLHPRAVREAVERAVAHPECYRAQSAYLQCALIDYARQLEMTDAVRQLQAWCTEPAQCADGDPGRPGTAPRSSPPAGSPAQQPAPRAAEQADDSSGTPRDVVNTQTTDRDPFGFDPARPVIGDEGHS